MLSSKLLISQCLVGTLLLSGFVLFAQESPNGQPTPESLQKSPGAPANGSGRKIEFPKPVPPPKPVESAVNALTNLAIKVLGPGVFELGSIRMDTTRRTVSFPATLNRDQGPMEYFLVSGYGKTHESILRTQVKPYDIHVAMLLLGAGGAGTNNFPGQTLNQVPSQISNPSPQILPGDKINIEVTWTKDGHQIKRPAEDLAFNSQVHSAAEQAHWVYNGSMIRQGRFLAQIDGSIVSLVTDPIALINNIGPGHDNDHIWTPNTNNLPPAEMLLEVTLQLQNVAPKK